MKSLCVLFLKTLYSFLLIFLVLGNLSARSKRVLYLGDSLSYGAFGKKMEKGLKQMGFRVYISVTGGGSPYYWLSSYPEVSSTIGYWEKTPYREYRRRYVRRVPKLSELMKKYRPDLVVIQSGTNLYATLRSRQRSKEGNRELVYKLISQMCAEIKRAGAISYWISPPHSHVKKYPLALQKEMTGLISQAVEDYGDTFRSLFYTRYNGKYPKYDGIHYGSIDARKWANSALSDMQGFLKKKKIKSGIFVDSGFDSSQLIKHDFKINPDKIMEKKQPSPFAANKSVDKKSDKATDDRIAVRLVKKQKTKLTDEQDLYNFSLKMLQAAFKGGLKNKTGQQNRAVKQVGEIAKVNLEDLIELKSLDDKGSEDYEAKVKQWEISFPGIKKIAKEVTNKKQAKQFTPSKNPLELNLELVQKSEVTDLNQVNYNRCFALYEYKVLQILRGEYPFETIRVAHMVVSAGKKGKHRRTRVSTYKLGKRLSLRLVPRSLYPKIEQEQCEDQLLINFDLPIYICEI